MADEARNPAECGLVGSHDGPGSASTGSRPHTTTPEAHALMLALSGFSLDLRHAWRTLLRQPTYTAVVVLTLALGIAGNAVMYSVVNPYLFRDLPYAEPRELVQLGQVDPASGYDRIRFSLGMYEDYRERTRAFDDLAAYHYGTRNLADDDRPVRMPTGVLTGNMFDVLGVEAELGRTFSPAEDGPAGADVVVLDHGLWRERYGADPGILGTTIRLDGVPHTVVGVMPERFVFPWNEVKLWVPMRVDAAAEPRDRVRHLVVGRLADGWDAERARAELESIQGELAAAHPRADGEFEGISVEPLRSALNFAWDALAVGLPMLLAAVGFVLLIVCVNVASLTLARASAREREISVRAAIGAGRGRLVRHLLTESGLLSLAGGLLGLGLAWWAISAISPLVPEDLYRVGDVTLDGDVLAYTAAVTLLTPFLFGLTPAVSASRTDLAVALRGGGRGRGAGRRTLFGRRALVVAEVALAIVLVAGAGLMLRSFGEVQSTELGFEPGRVLTVEVTLPEREYGTPADADAYFERATATLAALPAVEEAGAISALPMNHEMAVRQFAVPGAEPPTAREWPLAAYTRVSAGYFDAMGVEVRAGRAFREGDGTSGRDVIVISESLARRHFTEGSPVGRTLAVGDPGEPSAATVIGVVADVQQADLVYENRPQLYRPLEGTGALRRFLVMTTRREPSAAAGPVREALAGIDPDLPVAIRPMSEIVRENTFVWSLGSTVLGAFGAFAMLLAALGIYGVIAYSVERRRREIGIRMALGAGLSRVRKLIVGEGVRLAGIGVAVGLTLAGVAGHLMSAILFGVSPLDPVALGGAAALFLVVALASSWLPALRASGAEPARALREE